MEREDYLESSNLQQDYLSLNFVAKSDSFKRVWVVLGSYPEPPEGSIIILKTVPEITIRMRDARIMSIRYVWGSGAYSESVYGE